MPAPEVIQSLADAIGGVDREAAYRKGMAERADINNTEAQTEAAIQLARDRRLDAQQKERIAAAQEELREQSRRLQAAADAGGGMPGGGYDHTELDPFNVMASGFGDEYAGLEQGRLRSQEFNLRGRVAEPMSLQLGNELMDTDPALLHEMLRESSLEALAPASALATRRMDPSYEMVLQPDGSSIYMPARAAAGQPVGARPSTAGGAAATSGGLTTAVQNAIYRQAHAAFGGTYDPLTGRFSGLDRDQTANVQRLASRAAVIMRGGNVDIATAVDQALNEAQAAAESGGEIPPQFGDAIQDDDVDPQTGQPYEAVDAQGNRVRWVNGQWVPAQ